MVTGCLAAADRAIGREVTLAVGVEGRRIAVDADKTRHTRLWQAQWRQQRGLKHVRSLQLAALRRIARPCAAGGRARVAQARNDPACRWCRQRAGIAAGSAAAETRPSADGVTGGHTRVR